MSQEVDAGARAALRDYALAVRAVRPIEIGLINRTFAVEATEGRFVLQRVNPIFGPEVHQDIEAVTQHLSRKGLITTRLLRTQSGALYTQRGTEIWRVLTHLEGQTLEKLSSPEQARAAGALLGQFHAAIQDLEHDFKNRRLGVHDTPAHLALLRRALSEKSDHPRAAVVLPLGAEILATAQALPPLPAAPDRVVHGDPKVSNLLFDAEGRGLALIDLDTLARMPLVLELGDAFRSWCNPAGEDALSVHFDLALFGAAFDGYQEGAPGFLLPVERRAIVLATRTIILELAARFAADALYERYFGWDQTRFASRSEHNELRARGQLTLAKSLSQQAEAAEDLVKRSG